MNTYKRHRFTPEIISYLVCFIIDSTAVIGILRIYWPNVESPSITKPSGHSVSSSEPNTPGVWSDGIKVKATNSTSMKYLWTSMTNSIISGARWFKMEKWSMCNCKPAGMVLLLSVSSSIYLEIMTVSRERSWLTSCETIVLLTGKWSLSLFMWLINILIIEESGHMKRQGWKIEECGG